MTRGGVFGWDLPPGCSEADIERAAGFGTSCEVCGEGVDNCICPECPVCEEHGNPECYEKHGLVRSHEQTESMRCYEETEEKAAKQEQEYYENYLKEGGDNVPM